MGTIWKQKYIKAFGLNLRHLRKTKKLSQLALSKTSGVSLSHISRIERGVRSPSILTIKDLAFGLKLQPAKLLDYKFEKHTSK